MWMVSNHAVFSSVRLPALFGGPVSGGGSADGCFTPGTQGLRDGGNLVGTYSQKIVATLFSHRLQPFFALVPTGVKSTNI
jgi:hypothetical protein